MVSHRRSAKERRAQRARAEARFAGRLMQDGGTPTSGFAPTHALLRVMADVDNVMQGNDIPQEHVSERIVEQAVNVLVPQPMEGIVGCVMASAPAVTSAYIALALVIEYMTPAPGVTYAAPSPVIEFVDALAVSCAAPAPANAYGAYAPPVTDATPAPVTEQVASAGDVTYAAPAPMTRYADPARAVTYATPAPGTAYVDLAPPVTYATPAPVIKPVGTPAALYAAPAPVIESVGDPAVFHAAPAPVIESVDPSPAATKYSFCSSNRIRDMCTRCHQCDTCASD